MYCATRKRLYVNSKQRQTRASDSLTTFILGMLIVFIGYVAWGMLTISYKARIYEIAGIFFNYITAVLYVVLVVITGRIKNMMEFRQLKVVSGAGFLIALLLLFRTSDYIVLLAAWIIVFGGCLIYGMIIDKKSFRNILPIEVFKKYSGILSVMAVTCLFLYEPDAVQARWDGLLYYLTCMELDISSMSNLAVYGHIAQTYGIMNGIGGLIVGNTFAVMTGLNIFVMLSSVWGFYLMLKEMVPSKTESSYAVAVAAYAWSPFMLGMVYYYSLDFYCGCLFIWVLYTFYKRKWIYFMIFSLLFCFTKEPAIVIYGAVCAGAVLCDIMEQKGYSLTMRLRSCFVRKQYYLMILTGILWLVTYKALGPWSAGVGGFSVDTGYVVDKIKNLYVLNFNWLFTMLAIAGSIYIFQKGREVKSFKRLLPVWCSQIAFTLFSCLYNTVNHPRYNDTNQVTLYLLAIIPVLYYCQKRKNDVLMGIMSILCLVSSFITCDPVTRSCYNTTDIGKTTMIYTSDVPLGDGMIYNRQMLGFETALASALRGALDGSQAVLFPTIQNNAYGFDGMAEVGAITDSYMVETEFWDDVNKRRAAREEDGTRKFQAYQLTNETDWSKLEKEISGFVNYIYIPEVCDLYSGYIKEHYQILEETEHEHRGWVVKRICFML